LYYYYYYYYYIFLFIFYIFFICVLCVRFHDNNNNNNYNYKFRVGLYVTVGLNVWFNPYPFNLQLSFIYYCVLCFVFFLIIVWFATCQTFY